jgi:hypothetical protein
MEFFTITALDARHINKQQPLLMIVLESKISCGQITNFAASTYDYRIVVSSQLISFIIIYCQHISSWVRFTMVHYRWIYLNGRCF